MKLVHAADLHLDSPLRGLERYEGAPVSELRRATRVAFDRLIELCLRENADLLVIAGDLYDGNWRDPSTGLFFCERMARLREAGIPVVWIRGNHDAQSRLTQHLRLPQTVRELDTKRPSSIAFEHLNTVVHGQGYAKIAVNDDLAAAYPAPVPGAFNIGLLHTSLDGRPGHEPYAPCRLATLVDRGYDYWALGHVHAHEVVHREPWVVYPGNLQGRYVKELGPKGAVLVTIDDERVTAVEHHALDVVRWALVEVSAGSSATVDDVAENVRVELERASAAAEGRLLAARVRISGATAAHAPLHAAEERIVNEVRAAALDVSGGPVWVERVVVATRPEGGPEQRADRGGPLGELERAIAELRTDPRALEALVAEIPELTDVARKTRSAAGEDGDVLALLTLLDDVEGLLFARLADAREEEA